MIALLLVLAQALEQEARELQSQLDAVVQARRAAIAEKYGARVKEMEAAERVERASAIARFEKFLQLYPDEPRYTPDAMFRLAELEFDQAKDSAEPHFDKSIAWYRALMAKFPDYR